MNNDSSIWRNLQHAGWQAQNTRAESIMCTTYHDRTLQKLIDLGFYLIDFWNICNQDFRDSILQRSHGYFSQCHFKRRKNSVKFRSRAPDDRTRPTFGKFREREKRRDQTLFLFCELAIDGFQWKIALLPLPKFKITLPWRVVGCWLLSPCCRQKKKTKTWRSDIWSWIVCICKCLH